MFILIHMMKFIVEILKIFIVFKLYTGYKLTKNRLKIYFSTFVFLLTIFAIISDLLIEQNDITIILSFSVMLITVILFEGKKLKVLLTFLVVYLIICIFDMFFDNFAWLIYSTGVENYSLYIIRIFISELSSLFLILILSYILKKRKIVIILKIKSYLMLIFCSFMLSGFIAYSRFILINDNSKIYIILNILFSIMWLAFLITIFLFLNSQVKNEKYLGEINTNNEISKGKEIYYLMLSEKNIALNEFKHDYYEHLKIIKMLLMKKDYIKTEEYLKNICDFSEKSLINVNSGNIIINAIISDCLNKFKDDEIIYEFSGTFPSEVVINNMDMCTIFSNLILNSFEAASKFKGIKYVKIFVKKINENYYITIKNPLEKNDNYEGLFKKTSKKDKDCHGIGINNARRVLESHQGNLDFEILKNEVITKILVHL